MLPVVMNPSAPDGTDNAANVLLQGILSSGVEPFPDGMEITGAGDLPSAFAVTDLAVASIGAAGLAAAKLAHGIDGRNRRVRIDRRLASFWFATSLRPMGWKTPPAWDSIAGDYPARNGWIRLHTNAPAHKAAALKVLGTGDDRDAVAKAVGGWDAGEL